MEHWNYLLDPLLSFWPFLCIVIVLGAALRGTHWFLIRRHPDLSSERKFPRQITMLGLLLLGLILAILVLPVNETFRDRLLGLIGLLVSGIIAFSSTTIVANFMAGILLRITKPFKTGDFVRVGEYFGRVSERGLFDTELQTESRELIALPNTYLISNPVTAVLNSGTIISISLSLGFDIHHSQVEPLLIEAAEKSGLEEPFVHILEIGNYSITYRISGLLIEVKGLITSRSNLSRNVLDTLHGHGIEIMSPVYMNQRRMGDDKKVIPKFVREASSEVSAAAEQIAFDKADRAELIENEKQQLTKDLQKMESLLKEASGEDKDRIKSKIAEGRERLKDMEQKQDELNVDDRNAEPPAAGE
ncbi:mechanosensitive ion channel domain-containing protein [uncultured Desulfosarcina sp.]|uniref:mechanosensitive ion channel domain-containing protein n=1 Tax=uncultured Desulfosarcina sp. TaxID=218289 RepID=UPI0029C837A0|nr:mechanosensitive ion channel domain-containing protein [uncultured Desulfosarcina sp.]